MGLQLYRTDFVSDIQPYRFDRNAIRMHTGWDFWSNSVWDSCYENNWYLADQATSNYGEIH